MAATRAKNGKRRTNGTKKKGKSKMNGVPAKTEPAGLPIQVFADSGIGFEEADKDSYALPFLVVLQTNSPQCNEESAAYVDGAKAGEFLLTATGTVLDGKEGIEVVPCHFQRRMIEWAPRDSGGGFKGEHVVEEYKLAEFEREGSKFLLDNGNYLADTRQHFVLVLTDDGPRPAVLSLTSTQIKVSRNWMASMRDLRALNPESGKRERVSMMAGVWRLATVTQTNDKGTWKGLRPTFERFLDPSQEGDLELYRLAEIFHKDVTAGRAKVEHTEGDEDDSLPF